MAKKKNSQPIHYKISDWIENEIKKWLDPQFEVLVDISFRAKGSPLGPQGWGAIIQRMHLGKAHTHGLVFGLGVKPTCKDVQMVVATGRKALDESIEKSESLIIKPGPPKVDPSTVVPNMGVTGVIV